jgi:phospholipase/carboxylesterase
LIRYRLAFVHRYKPAGRDGRITRPPPHGTGGKADDLVGLAHGIAPDAALRSPRGEVLNDGEPAQRVWHAASRGGQTPSA